MLCLLVSVLIKQTSVLSTVCLVPWLLHFCAFCVILMLKKVLHAGVQCNIPKYKNTWDVVGPFEKIC